MNDLTTEMRRLMARKFPLEAGVVAIVVLAAPSEREDAPVVSGYTTNTSTDVTAEVLRAVVDSIDKGNIIVVGREGEEDPQ